MHKRLKLTILLTLLLSSVSIACILLAPAIRDLLSDILYPARDIEVSLSESIYSFDPFTVQEAIKTGRQDIFKLEWQRDYYAANSSRPTSYTYPTPDPSRIRTMWSEADFDALIEAFTQRTANEPLDDTTRTRVEFDSACGALELRLQKLRYENFKSVLTPDGEHYYKKSITVDLNTGRLTWLQSEDSELSQKPQVLAINSTYIPAETALKIAEDAGGSAFRIKHHNACIQTGSLYTGVSNDEWLITYELIDAPTIGGITIQIDKNKRTGRIVAVGHRGP